MPAATDSTTGPRPGATLGVVAFVLSFFLWLIGLVLGIIALVQSKRAGQKNGFAVAAIVIGSALIVIGTIVGVIVVVTIGFGAAADLVNLCAASDTGTVTYFGEVIDCADLTE
ncbi:DUF4190 domain-containing protein [Microbacterium sp. NPDC076768]|uniref:DUF4190 domain-containing protein n=1 Tax=Microbacterium sp. NPDC076768 TaxID=3154858 RepID=UPI003432230F